MTRSRALRAASRARGRGETLGNDGLGRLRVLFEERPEGLAHHLGDVGLHFRVHQLDLGLRLELRVGVLDADDGGQALARIVAGEVGVGFLQQAALAGIIVDHARQGRAHAGQVRAAVHRVDGIGKRIDRLGIGIGVLDGAFDADAFDFLFDVHHRVQGLAVAVQVAHEGGDAAFEVKGHFAVAALVQKVDGDAARDEGHLAEALDEGVEAVFERFGEDQGVVLEGGGGAGIAGFFGFPNHFDRLLGMAAHVTLEVDLAIAPDLHLAPFGKRIDRRDAHPVQAAGDLVAAAAKFAAGMQFGHHHFQGRLFLGRVDIHRDAAPVVDHGDG